MYYLIDDVDNVDNKLLCLTDSVVYFFFVVNNNLTGLLKILDSIIVMLIFRDKLNYLLTFFHNVFNIKSIHFI